jgi:hypothetical protein
MKADRTKKEFRLGDLVAAACDAAQRETPDPNRAVQVASRQIAAWLARLNRGDLIRRLQAA